MEMTPVEALELLSARVRPTSRPGETDAALQVIGRRLAQISALEGRIQGMEEGAEYVRRELSEVRAERDRLQAEVESLRGVLKEANDILGDVEDEDGDLAPLRMEIFDLLRDRE